MLFTPIKPMLMEMGKKVVDDEKWLFDIKWDGWRILLHKQGERIEAYTRQGNLVTDKFPELYEVVHHIKVHTAIIDTEGVVLRKGIPIFEDFSYRARLTSKQKIKQAMQTHPATFIAFDVLVTDKPHLNEPLIDRKERLSSIIEPSDVLVTTPFVKAFGTTLFDITKEKGMEGIVGKRIFSTYQMNKRSSDWIKYKHFKYKDAIILGYKEKPFAMIVGNYFYDRIKPIAMVQFGFKPEEKQAFRKIAQGLVIKEEKNIRWIEPVLCCTVQYLDQTENHHLRIVSFKGFNFEKKAEDCIWNR